MLSAIRYTPESFRDNPFPLKMSGVCSVSVVQWKKTKGTIK